MDFMKALEGCEYTITTETGHQPLSLTNQEPDDCAAVRQLPYEPPNPSRRAELADLAAAMFENLRTRCAVEGLSHAENVFVWRQIRDSLGPYIRSEIGYAWREVRKATNDADK